jgi:hypothetical protein
VNALWFEERCGWGGVRWYINKVVHYAVHHHCLGMCSFSL